MKKFGYFICFAGFCLLSAAAPQKQNCSCTNCQCTPENHCGCYTNQGCHCSQDAKGAGTCGGHNHKAK